MREAHVFQLGVRAGVLRELILQARYEFVYAPEYAGTPISLSMPVRREAYLFAKFPPFFEGLLPEGYQLEALLRHAKLDRSDYLGQLLQVGRDLVGSVTILAP